MKSVWIGFAVSCVLACGVDDREISNLEQADASDGSAGQGGHGGQSGSSSNTTATTATTATTSGTSGTGGTTSATGTTATGTSATTTGAGGTPGTGGSGGSNMADAATDSRADAKGPDATPDRAIDAPADRAIDTAPAVETVCTDSIDNDGDTKVDCADSDCDGKLCLDKIGDTKLTTGDSYRTTLENGTTMVNDGTTVLAIYRGGSSGPHPYQSSTAIIAFSNLPQVTAATIVKATLRFYYTNPVSATVVVKDGDSQTQQCMGTLGVQTSLTAFDCDVTPAIRNWFATNLRQDLRRFEANTPSFGDQDIAVSALEGPAATAPRLLLNYQTKCTSMTCPGL